MNAPLARTFTKVANAICQSEASALGAVHSGMRACAFVALRVVGMTREDFVDLAGKAHEAEVRGQTL